MHEQILKINSNQTNEYISCATDYGYKIFRIEPFSIVHEHNFHGSLSVVSMLYSSNILFIAGGVRNPVALNGPNTFTIWDMEKTQILKTIEYTNNIFNIFSTLKYIVLQFHDYLTILNLNTLQEIYTFSTIIYCPLSIQSFNNTSILSWGSQNKGEIQIWKKKVLIKFQASSSKCHGIHINSSCSKILICSENHIKIYNSRNLFIINEIDIDHDSQRIKSFLCDNNGDNVLIYYYNENICIYNIETNNKWTLYIPNILSVGFINSSIMFPRLYIITTNELSISLIMILVWH